MMFAVVKVNRQGTQLVINHKLKLKASAVKLAAQGQLINDCSQVCFADASEGTIMKFIKRTLSALPMATNMFISRIHTRCLKQMVVRYSNIPQAFPITDLKHITSSRIFYRKFKTLSTPITLTGDLMSKRVLVPCVSNTTTFNQRRCIYEDNKTKSLAIIDNLKEIKSSPVPALALGFAGLIPFMAAPGYMIMSQVFMTEIAFAQMTYGATILAFLGGVRWGFAVPEESKLQPDWVNLGISVVPSLVAWLGLLLPDPASLFTVMFGLAGAGYYDMVTWGYPPWFKGLRFCLTFVAVISLWTTFMCKILMKSKPVEESST